MLYTLSRLRGIACLWLSMTAINAWGTDSDSSYLDRPMPIAWETSVQVSDNAPLLEVAPDWWNRFDDPTLTKLIEQGLSHNYDIAMALHRIEVARLTVLGNRSDYLPTVGVSAGWSKSQQSGLIYGTGGKATDMSAFNLGANLSWEIDLFGRINSRVKESKARFNATRAESEGVRLTVAAEIARQYIQIRTWQAELAIANEHLSRQEKVLKITEARKEAGLGSGLEVAQAKVVYYSTLATLPMLKNSISTGINALGVLVGEYPADIRQSLDADAKLPSVYQLIDPAVPTDLLRRRPDIVQASQLIEAQLAAAGIARKEYLPTLTLHGTIGTETHRAGDLFKSQSLTYSIAPTLSWTVFDGMARRYNVEIARNQLESQIENYNLTVMTAVEEVNNALQSYDASLRHIEAIDRVNVEANKSLEFAIDLYKRGLNPFTDVVTAQMNCLQYQDQAVQAQGEALLYLVTLYKALGGGWQ